MGSKVCSNTLFWDGTRVCSFFLIGQPKAFWSRRVTRSTLSWPSFQKLDRIRRKLAAGVCFVALGSGLVVSLLMLDVDDEPSHRSACMHRERTQCSAFVCAVSVRSDSLDIFSHRGLDRPPRVVSLCRSTLLTFGHPCCSSRQSVSQSEADDGRVRIRSASGWFNLLVLVHKLPVVPFVSLCNYYESSFGQLG